MGHSAAMVIGDAPIDQLERFQRAEYADPTNRHFVTTDVTEHVRARHELWCKGPLARPSWLRPYDGLCVLEPGQAPDLAKAHSSGWVSLTSDGAILEAYARDIPNGFVDWFEGTGDRLKLKDGASGLSIDANGQARTVTGYAGSARKRDVDLAGICQPFRDEAARWWDRAMAACGAKTWVSHRDIWKRYEAQQYSQANDIAAIKEWVSQPSVAAIIAATREDKPSYMHLSHYDVTQTPSSWNQRVTSDIDRLLWERSRYVTAHGLQLALWFSEIIRHGELVDPTDTSAFFDSLPGDTMLTL